MVPNILLLLFMLAFASSLHCKSNLRCFDDGEQIMCASICENYPAVEDQCPCVEVTYSCGEIERMCTIITFCNEESECKRWRGNIPDSYFVNRTAKYACINNSAVIDGSYETILIQCFLEHGHRYPVETRFVGCSAEHEDACPRIVNDVTDVNINISLRISSSTTNVLTSSQEFTPTKLVQSTQMATSLITVQESSMASISPSQRPKAKVESMALGFGVSFGVVILIISTIITIIIVIIVKKKRCRSRALQFIMSKMKIELCR